MNPTEQRIAIAEACGWKWYRRPATGPWANKPYRVLYHPQIVPEFMATLQEADMSERQCNDVFLWREGIVPDYLNDLNAMHEAENTGLKDVNELSRYLDELDRVCVPTHICPTTHAQAVIMATASQRAEAFLRTKGLWKDHDNK